jgi:hypothetical protein
VGFNHKEHEGKFYIYYGGLVMGLFLSLSGVVGKTTDTVLEVLKDYISEENEFFELSNAETLEEPSIGSIIDNKANTTILYPADFMNWEQASSYLSEKLCTAVFSFHIHDGDFWMYNLFHEGREIDAFLPFPEYWEQISPEEKETLKGNRTILAKHIPHLQIEAIERYLIEWDINQLNENKAYDDDEFTIGNCWQICDFMKKVPLPWPEENGKLLGQAIEIKEKQRPNMYNTKNDTEAINTQKAKSQVKSSKPWWRFW